MTSGFINLSCSTLPGSNRWSTVPNKTTLVTCNRVGPCPSSHRMTV